VLANFVSNEMFLETAAKRSNVIMHSKALGYRPRSITSARIKVGFKINTLSLQNGATAPNSFTIQAGTAFSTTIGDTPYQFVTAQNYSAMKAGDGTYDFDTIELVEGVFYSFQFLVNQSEPSKNIYIIPNANVDTSTIKMEIQTSISDISRETWYYAPKVFAVDSQSAIFFTQESVDRNGYTELYFGNGVVGKVPNVGNIVLINYVISSGAGGNGAKTFYPMSSILNNGDPNIIANTFEITTAIGAVSSGGTEQETIEEIKYNASNYFLAQNRAVTPTDFKALIIDGFSNVKTIKVWGGEENVPAYYGQVFVCIQPQYGDYLTDSEKQTIKELLKDKSVATIGINFSDPDYVNIETVTAVYYDPIKTTPSTDIASIVKLGIRNYSENELQTFSSHFRYSKFIGSIDAMHQAINSNTTTVKMYKVISPKTGLNTSYIIQFYNEIKKENYSISSSYFSSSASEELVRLTNFGSTLYLSKDDAGVVNLIQEIGSVDFNKGILYINSLDILSSADSELKVSAIPQKNDIESSLNNILRIRAQDISVYSYSETSNSTRKF
jgi:hypothetical protein